MKSWFSGTTIGMLLLAATVCASLVRVARVRQQLDPPGKVTLRIAHWQLEGTHREAIDAAIADYEILHPDVHVIQMGVSQTVYSQWLNTRLIGGDAPDLAELGMSKLSRDDQYTVRFFRTLSDVLAQPNPYNKGTSLESTPWKETFIDGMRGGFSDTLQDYFKIPTTMFVWRLFYNKTLLKEATGSDQPPKTLGQLIDVCEKLRKLPRPRGREIQPIVNSNGPWMFVESLNVSFTAKLENDLDTDLSGDITDLEGYAGFVEKKWNMQSPPLHELYACVKKICGEFPEGFMSMDRQTAVFTFSDQRAAFLTSGSWDAQSIAVGAKDKYGVGVMEIPIPGAGEPWGDDVVGQATEAVTSGGVGYGVAKSSRHTEQAIDFLRFLTAQDRNGRYMAIAGWPPVIIDSPTSDAMKPFKPNVTGFLANLTLNIGTQVNNVLDAQRARFLQGEITYDEFAKKYEAALADPSIGGDRAWLQKFKELALQTRAQEQVLAVQSVRELMDPAAKDAPEKFRRVLLQQVRKNNGRELKARFEAARGVPLPLQ